MLQFDNASSIWNFDSETLKLRAEFLLLVQNLIDSLPENDSEVREICVGILEIGMKRLKPEVDDESVVCVDGGRLMCLRRVILEYADIFDVLCGNVYRQIREWESDDVHVNSKEEEDVRILGLILKTVQVVHLDAMRQSMKEGDVNEVILHIRFLRFDHGVEESEYRYVHFLSLNIYV